VAGNMPRSETIAAVATARGKSALAIIRISGSDAFKIFSRIVLNTKTFISAPARYIGLYTIVDSKTKEIIDEVTAVKYLAPKSFTGENMVEIICHGGTCIVDEITESIISAGARPAGRGAFTRRALENKKIDLIKAEAIRGMIESSSNFDLACARKLYNQPPVFLKEWRETLINILAEVEAIIEYEEEDENIAKIKEKSLEKLDKIIKKLEKEIKKREKIRNVENYLKVVIAGPANAGKSSLFNLLLGQNRSIVHDDPGTTRDLISENVWICGYHLQLIDSAGIRSTIHEIEKQGIERSREAYKKAGLIIWVTDASEPFSKEEIDEINSLKGKEIICVINKTDICSGKRKFDIAKKMDIEAVEISVKENRKIELVTGKIVSAIKRVSEEIEIPDMFLNERYEEKGKEVYKETCFARKEWGRPEIAAYHLRNGINRLEEIFGKKDDEEILDKIFSKFCIGK
jgi:tRNA modification GTPase